jgi:hypothetical protein
MSITEGQTKIMQGLKTDNPMIDMMRKSGMEIIRTKQAYLSVMRKFGSLTSENKTMHARMM